jgi:hypothetical protein
MEPSGIDMTMLGSPGTAEPDERLVVASRLSTRLAVAHSRRGRRRRGPAARPIVAGQICPAVYRCTLIAELN